ncbi:hypothetical protein SB659_16950 [Arthrobacter sp. SIMBA_036]|uniref:hypothetical protein n=1 Tax=Arthrobacter sp. SIMBA_036 TaxID=3085778 RepID=UPI00397B5BD0
MGPARARRTVSAVDDDDDGDGTELAGPQGPLPDAGATAQSEASEEPEEALLAALAAVCGSAVCRFTPPIVLLLPGGACPPGLLHTANQSGSTGCFFG